jgi:hypothetical protein
MAAETSCPCPPVDLHDSCGWLPQGMSRYVPNDGVRGDKAITYSILVGNNNYWAELLLERLRLAAPDDVPNVLTACFAWHCYTHGAAVVAFPTDPRIFSRHGPRSRCT